MKSKLTLKLTAEEASDLKGILLREHAALIRSLSTHVGCGRSVEAMEACHRRSRVEHLMECLEDLHGPQLVRRPARRVRLAVAA